MYSSGNFPGGRSSGRITSLPPLGIAPIEEHVFLGAVRLLRPVGAGAMAHVWRGEHRTAGVPLAVKVLTRAETAEVPLLFAHEVRSVARLSHPAIVRLHDHGVIPPEVAMATSLPVAAPYLVMDWLSGGSLRERAAGMEWPEVVHTLVVLLDALAHAHARGVIHRDLKPDNVLFGERGPVLTDFGVAASLDEGQSSRLLVGTPNYMAPEQVRGDWRALGPWTDLYAIGCLAWLLTSGSAPFAGAGRQAVLRAHLSQEPPQLQPLMAVPEGFERWVRWLLAKSPADRPRFAAQALGGLLALPGVAGLALPERASVGGAEVLPANWRTSTPLANEPLLGMGRALAGLREVGLQGRDHERDLLWKALRRTADRGRPQLVLLEGPAGSGKSRLAAWLLRRAHELGVGEGLVARHARQPGPGQGLGPMVARALRCFDLPEDARRVRVIEALGGFGAEDETAFLPALVALLEEEEGAVERPLLTTEAERVATLRRCLAQLAGGRPLLLHVDDLQWGLESLRFVHALLDAGDATPLLVLGTVSEGPTLPECAELLARLRSHRAVEVVPVGPLPREALVAFCSALLPLGEDTLHRLTERAQGSPLFAEEVIRHWIRTDALESTAKGFELRSTADNDLPAEVGLLWQARLGEVLGQDEVAWRASELAAALGVVVEPMEWRTACELGGLSLPADLPERLEAAALLMPEGRRLRFAHPMAREALRARSIAAGRFETWNSCCADMLEASRVPDVERLSHHLQAARRWREALEPLGQAARRHLDRGDHLAARRLLMARARALRLLGVPRHSSDWLETGLAWAEQAVARGELTAAHRRARGVLARARGGRNRVQALVVLGQIERRRGRDGLTWLNEGLTAAEAVGEPRLLARARLETAFGLADQGRLLEAESLARQVVRAEGTGSEALRAEGRYAVAYISWRRSRVHQAELFAEAAFADFRALGARDGMARAAQLAGIMAEEKGDSERARQRYRESLALIEAAGGRDRAEVLSRLAVLHLEAGEVGEARTLLLEGRQEVVRQRSETGLRRARFDFWLLACDAHTGRWSSCEARLETAALLRDAVPERAVARVAWGVADLAESAGQHRVADSAWAIARAHLLDRPAEAEALQAACEGARLRRHRPARILI